MEISKKKNYNNPVTATISGIRDVFSKHEPAGILRSSDRFEGKTVLVDGSSSGLGFAVAVDVAKRGAKLIMACRSGIPDKGEEVKKLSGSKEVYMLPVDFADIPAIHELAKNIKARFGPIDVLICNAGMVPRSSRKTPQGLEQMFMVNYLSKFIFVNRLLEEQCFRTGSPQMPRIIFTASETHRDPKGFDWDSFGVYKEFTIGRSIELYGYYKLLLTTFAVELSRRLNRNGPKCSVFALCPGPVNTNIGREAPKIFHPLMKVMFSIFFRSPAKAATPIIYLAASPDLERKPLDYFFLMTRREIDDKALNPENGKKLWELSETLVKNLQE